MKGGRTSQKKLHVSGFYRSMDGILGAMGQESWRMMRKNTQTRNPSLGEIGALERRWEARWAAHTPDAWVSGSLFTVSNDIFKQRPLIEVGGSRARQVPSWARLLSGSVGNSAGERLDWGAGCLLSLYVACRLGGTQDLLITGGRSQSWSKQVILQNGKTRIEEHFS